MILKSFLFLHFKPYLKLTAHILKNKRASSIENRIHREDFTRKKCKTAILLYCFHTAGVLHIFYAI